MSITSTVEVSIGVNRYHRVGVADVAESLCMPDTGYSLIGTSFYSSFFEGVAWKTAEHLFYQSVSYLKANIWLQCDID